MAVTERPPAAPETERDQTELLLLRQARSDWVRLRTLLVLRWLAIGGQTVAVVIAAFYMGLRLELGLCVLAIGASVVSNLIAMVIFPENHLLSDRDAMLTLLFDLTQLAFLLFLTGGLNNPFALLILAPVTISATALTLRSTVLLGLIAIALITLLAFVHVPLATATGELLALPGIFVAGFWCAIIIGIIFLSAYARRVATESHSMSQALAATQMALAREQKLTDLGGVVAATAHELGTPLATIKLVSTELVEELCDRPDLQEDARLIHDQADRCRDILRSMGRVGKEDAHMRAAPLAAVLREAAEPHADRGIEIGYNFNPEDEADRGQPVIFRKPEVIHGLRNLVQNAVDFAHAQVWIDGDWTPARLRIRVMDDGPGFPPDMLGRLGEPFLRRRRDGGSQRPGYEGMGLGLFIAKTLLERSGAEVAFRNGSDPFLADHERVEMSGAVVEVTWPIGAIARRPAETSAPLGENRPLSV
ncbi:ActS/PrrB/RegB family redox-sensitive histidine kinase [Rhodobacterales bacterium HKCCE3408]|nr:ActS/PrrB/RegB family redox-sensitive histidine kinase [Rhodobacterales bacterium HKCCE3408]